MIIPAGLAKVSPAFFILGLLRSSGSQAVGKCGNQRCFPESQTTKVSETFVVYSNQAPAGAGGNEVINHG
jgi:hypothetical protein